ncbi:MAG TPA: FtsX-like permease family protein, partial [Acidimicrobiia bacterium]|nr:FtsX-like permease family protein [Acidimicrobiia bacterium]
VLALGVRRADPNGYLAIGFDEPTGTPPQGINGLAIDFGSLDGTMKILEGRRPAPGDPFGVMVNEWFVRQFHKHVGDTVPARMFRDADAADAASGNYHPTGPRERFHITGVVRTPDDIALDAGHGLGTTALTNANEMLVPVAFYDQHHQEFWNFGLGYDVELGNVDRTTFERKITDEFSGGDQPPSFGSPRFAQRHSALRTPVDLETIALLALGIAIALAGAVTVAVMLRAEQRAGRADHPTLEALGMTRSQLGAIAALRSMPVGLTAGVLTIVVGFALSRFTPIGIGRQLEPHPGFSADVAVLAAGGLAVVSLCVILAFALEYRRRGARVTRRPVHSSAWIARTGAPNDVVVGTHLAFERGRVGRSVPTRAAIIAATTALVVVTSAVVFRGSVDNLYASPSAHGWPWDVLIGNVNFKMKPDRRAKLAHDPRIVARTFAREGAARVEGREIDAIAYDAKGTAPPQMLSGRLPTTANEIALGDRLLSALHKHVGDTVKFSIADDELDSGHAKDVNLKVVGVGVLPTFGEADFGQSALLSREALKAAGGDANDMRLAFVRVRGPDRTATVQALHRDYTEEMVTDNVPARVVNLHRVRSLLLIAVGLAALLGVAVVAYTLAIGVRARRRELGVLRAIGMSSRHVGHALAWQGVALAAVIVVVGIPIGLGLGSIAWRTVARQLGVGDSPVIRVGMLWLVPAAFAIAIVCSRLPAMRARRQTAGELLRVE